jgi:hypothetical protein
VNKNHLRKRLLMNGETRSLPCQAGVAARIACSSTPGGIAGMVLLREETTIAMETNSRLRDLRIIFGAD